MYLADYHMHSKYSFDGSEELDTICQTAIRRGLSEIAIQIIWIFIRDCLTMNR